MSAPGRTRVKLAALLGDVVGSELSGVTSFKIDASALWSNKSAARSHDDTTGTWGGTGTATAANGSVHAVSVGSYETMGDCLRRGIEVGWRRSPFCSGVDVTAKSERGAADS